MAANHVRRIAAGTIALTVSQDRVEITPTELDVVRRRVFDHRPKRSLSRSTTRRVEGIRVHEDLRVNDTILRIGQQAGHQFPEIRKFAQHAIATTLASLDHDTEETAASTNGTTSVGEVDLISIDSNGQFGSTTRVTDTVPVTSSIASEIADDDNNGSRRRRVTRHATKAQIEEIRQSASDDDSIDDGDESFDEETVDYFELIEQKENDAAEWKANQAKHALSSPMSGASSVPLLMSVPHYTTATLETAASLPMTLSMASSYEPQVLVIPLSHHMMVADANDNDGGVQVVTSLRPTPRSTPIGTPMRAVSPIATTTIARDATATVTKPTIAAPTPAPAPAVPSNIAPSIPLLPSRAPSTPTASPAGRRRVVRNRRGNSIIDRLYRLCRYYLLGIKRDEIKTKKAAMPLRPRTADTSKSTITHDTCNTATNDMTVSSSSSAAPNRTISGRNNNNNDDSVDALLNMSDAALGVAVTLVALALMRRHMPSMFRAVTTRLTSTGVTIPLPSSAATLASAPPAISSSSSLRAVIATSTVPQSSRTPHAQPVTSLRARNASSTSRIAS